MNKQKRKVNLRKRRHARVRALIRGSAKIPRVAVFKSHNYIYSQAIDDERGVTIVEQNDRKTKPVKEDKTKNIRTKEQKAFSAGKLLAEKMKGKKITQAVFDRGGFSYHGRVKAFADGLRKGGIKV